MQTYDHVTGLTHSVSMASNALTHMLSAEARTMRRLWTIANELETASRRQAKRLERVRHALTQELMR